MKVATLVGNNNRMPPPESESDDLRIRINTNKPFTCLVCNKTFQSRETLSSHKQQREHGIYHQSFRAEKFQLVDVIDTNIADY